MVHPDFKSLRAVGTLVGSVVGAGIFGLPFAFAQSGPEIGAAWLLALGAVVLALFLMYAEVVNHTSGSHRLGGYVERYLGPKWGTFATTVFAGALLGSMVAYVILGSRFLFDLLNPLIGGTEPMYAIGMTFAAAAVTWRGTKFTSRAEGVVVGVLLFLFTFAILAALPHVTASNLTMTRLDGVLLPYGVILFALSGLGAVPEMKVVLGSAHRRLPHMVTYGLFLVVMLYLAFSLAVVGVTGAATTPSAFTGLTAVLGGSFGTVSSLLGVLTIFSIFSMSGLQLQNSLRYDLHVPRGAAWVMASFPPVLLYLLGIHTFIGLVGFVGSVFSGLVGIIVVFTYERMRRSPVCTEHRCINVPSLVSLGIVLLFAAGVITGLMTSVG